jgi:molecular chaperone GrpE
LAEEDKMISENEVHEIAEEVDIESLKQAITEEKEKAEKYLANWQLAEADFRNYKKREDEEKKDLINWANSTLVCDILPVLDAFDRAFKGVTPKDKGLSWVTGFRQIQRMLLDVLNKHGLTEVKCVGDTFDPSLHEAVAQQEGVEGLVVDEVRKGYKLKDRLLRAPQVVVGKNKEELTSKVPEESTGDLTKEVENEQK